MSEIMSAMGYKNEFEPTGIVVNCTGNGRHNGKTGTVYNNTNCNKLYVKFDGDGIFIRIGSLQDRGYKFKSYQEWAQDALK